MLLNFLIFILIGFANCSNWFRLKYVSKKVDNEYNYLYYNMRLNDLSYSTIKKSDFFHVVHQEKKGFGFKKIGLKICNFHDHCLYVKLFNGRLTFEKNTFFKFVRSSSFYFKDNDLHHEMPTGSFCLRFTGAKPTLYSRFPFGCLFGSGDVQIVKEDLTPEEDEVISTEYFNVTANKGSNLLSKLDQLVLIQNKMKQLNETSRAPVPSPQEEAQIIVNKNSRVNLNKRTPVVNSSENEYKIKKGDP